MVNRVRTTTNIGQNGVEGVQNILHLTPNNSRWVGWNQTP